MNKYLKNLINIEDKYSKILHLSANENILSPLAERFLFSNLNVRYYMGAGENGVAFFGRNAGFKGMPEVQPIINEAQIKAQKMLHAGYVSLSCLSGINAMMCAILSLTEPGDLIMSVPSNQGGHFCTKGIIERAGRRHIYSEYDYKNLTFDIKKIADICKRDKVKAIYFDVSVSLKPHDIKKLKRILKNNILIFYDASHTLGLIMGGEFQSPLQEGADIICANTHKTLPGPHRGLIAFKNAELGKKIDNFITHNFISTVQTSSLLSLAVTIIEFDKFGKAYARQVINNANALGNFLSKKGLEVRMIDKNTYTNNHQLHIFINIDRKEAVANFLKNNISINTSGALGGRLFLRIGVQEVTKRGMKERDMKIIAGFVFEILQGNKISNKVKKFNKEFSGVKYCFKI